MCIKTCILQKIVLYKSCEVSRNIEYFMQEAFKKRHPIGRFHKFVGINNWVDLILSLEPIIRSALRKKFYSNYKTVSLLTFSQLEIKICSRYKKKYVWIKKIMNMLFLFNLSDFFDPKMI